MATKAEDVTAAAAAAAAVKAAAKVVADEAKRVEAERKATKEHAFEIVVLRGLARAFWLTSRELAELFERLADSLIADKQLSDDIWTDIALALKDRSLVDIAAKITALLAPATVVDHSVPGVLRAVSDGTISAEQGSALLKAK